MKAPVPKSDLPGPALRNDKPEENAAFDQGPQGFDTWLKTQCPVPDELLKRVYKAKAGREGLLAGASAARLMRTARPFVRISFFISILHFCVPL